MFFHDEWQIKASREILDTLVVTILPLPPPLFSELSKDVEV
jgi:hypothetical protein